MSQDWWSAAADEREPGGPQKFQEIHLEPVTPALPEPEPEEEQDEPTDRRRGLAAGAALTAVAGIAVYLMMPNAEKPQEDRPSTPVASRSSFLPAAGGGPSSAPRVTPSRTVLNQVTVLVKPSGKGNAGWSMSVSVINGTQENLTFSASMMRSNEGYPGIIGEGTLAPGARTVEPGGVARGTVEFSGSLPPLGVSLLSLSGNVVATGRVGS